MSATFYLAWFLIGGLLLAFICYRTRKLSNPYLRAAVHSGALAAIFGPSFFGVHGAVVWIPAWLFIIYPWHREVLVFSVVALLFWWFVAYVVYIFVFRLLDYFLDKDDEW